MLIIAFLFRLESFNPWPTYPYSGSLQPVYPLSPKRALPSSIQRTDYANDPNGYSRCEMQIRGSTKIQTLNEEEIEKMRVVCRIGREVLEEGAKAVAVGVTTDELDRIVHEACIGLLFLCFANPRFSLNHPRCMYVERDAYPSPLNYYKFPKSCCTSVNEVICHGIPDQYKLKDGDICNIDVSVYHNGFHSDLNETYLVGNVDEMGVKLVKNARRCLDEAISEGNCNSPSP